MKSMKKILAIPALILAFAVLIASCGTSSDTKKTRSRDNDDDKEEEVTDETADTKDTEETEEPPKTEETGETYETAEPVPDEPASDLYEYRYILDDVLYYTSGNVLEDDLFDLAGMGELALYNTFSELQEDVGYILKDVNGDGIPELMIVYNPSGDTTSYNVVALYTMTEDQLPWLVAQGWTRNNVYLMDDDTFMSVGSGGAANTYISLYRLDEDNEIEDLANYYTDFEDPDDFNSDICWFEIVDNEAVNMGPADEFAPDLGSAEIKDIKDEFVPICENEHYYQVIIGDFTYEEAVEKCKELGGRLATIDSERDAYTIAAFLGYNTEFAQVFIGEPMITEGGFIDLGGSGDYYLASISGEDGSLILTRTSSDPVSDNPSISGFMGLICETDYK